MKGCQCIPPSPCLPCILGSFELGYVGGWKDCYAEADASNHLAFIDTPSPPKSPVFIFSIAPVRTGSARTGPVRLPPHKTTTQFYFSFFHFFPKSWNPLVPWLCRALRNANYAKYQFSVITSVPSSVMQSYQGFAGFRQSPDNVPQSRRLPAACRAAAVPLY